MLDGKNFGEYRPIRLHFGFAICLTELSKQLLSFFLQGSFFTEKH